ncbi:unnamed protein product [Calypogeia fissa]
MNAEVDLILTRKYDQLTAFSDDAPNQISQVFEKSLRLIQRSFAIEAAPDPLLVEGKAAEVSKMFCSGQNQIYV